MERITRARVNLRAQTVSGFFTSGLYVSAEGRNGYVGLDLYDESGMVRNLICGTNREVYTYLGGMLATLEIIGRA
jgi:hypothetical protein